VKAATSDLLSANCDEFIFYDDLVREQEAKKTRSAKKAPVKAAISAKTVTGKGEEKAEDPKHEEALDLLVETVEALLAERGGEATLWGSMVKPTLQRRKPGFTESYYGYRSFRDLLEDAKKKKLLIVERDEKTGQYAIRLPADE
jgi:hypothetical protein